MKKKFHLAVAAEVKRLAKILRNFEIFGKYSSSALYKFPMLFQFFYFELFSVTVLFHPPVHLM